MTVAGKGTAESVRELISGYLTYKSFAPPEATALRNVVILSAAKYLFMARQRASRASVRAVAYACAPRFFS